MSEQLSQQHTGTLVLSDTESYVGDTVSLQGRNLAPETEYEIRWHSVEGSWGILEGNEVVGPQYRPRTDVLGTVTTDESGRFDEEMEVPEDYGGEHDIEIRHGEETVAEATLEIHQHFELDRTTAPLGETFTVVGYGLGPDKFENNYQITWDNQVVGFVTGIKNRGTAAAEIRAVGPVGEHPIQVWRNYRGVPFLQNNTQSPFGKVCNDRESMWTVEVTEPESEFPTAWSDTTFDEQPLAQHVVEPEASTGADLSITPTSGQAGTEATIEGDGFPADTAVELVWYTHDGHCPTNVPITPEPREDVLGPVETDGEGAFEHEFTIPTSVGSTRSILAEVDGESVASVGFMQQPDVHSISPTSGPVGTEIEIELSGVGWPRYENAYYLVYDNSPVGYVCGLDNDDGVVRTRIPAAGEPGTHFIDIYPSFYDIQEDQPDFELMPHLSYGNNHPVRPMPALHFTFEITE